MRTQLIDAKPVIGKAIGMCPDDPRVVEIINEATQRMLPEGKWVGTYMKYRFCASEACITLPRSLETIEAAAICGWPITIRNQWFEFVSEGPGTLSGCGCGFADRGGGFCAFNDVVGTNKKLRVYTDTAATPGSLAQFITLYYWDENGNYVRTQDANGVWRDGEEVLISTTATNATHFCSAGNFVAARKPITNGTVYIYEYDTVALTQRLIASYEPDEEIPDYRRYFIPQLSGTITNGTCNNQSVEVMAKLRYIPAVNDTDFLLIGNLGALKLACIGIDQENKRIIQESLAYLGMARDALEKELSQFLGDGARTVVQIESQDRYSDYTLSLL